MIQPPESLSPSTMLTSPVIRSYETMYMYMNWSTTSSMQQSGDRVAIKVFTHGADFKALKREIDVVKALPPHHNIVSLFGVEEEVCVGSLASWCVCVCW